MYRPLLWLDHAITPANTYQIITNSDGTVTLIPEGTVIQQGTNLSAFNFNHMEEGIFDVHIAASLLLNFSRQTGWRVDELEKWVKAHNIIEVGTSELTNNLRFPFNNSKKSVALQKTQNSTNYIVMTSVLSSSGNVGEVEVSDKLTNGFKLAYNGSASTATIKYIVIGGFNE